MQCGVIKTWNDIRQEIKAKEDLEKSLCETLNDSSKLESFIINHSYSYLQNWEDYGSTILNDSGNRDSFKINISLNKNAFESITIRICLNNGTIHIMDNLPPFEYRTSLLFSPDSNLFGVNQCSE